MKSKINNLWKKVKLYSTSLYYLIKNTSNIKDILLNIFNRKQIIKIKLRNGVTIRTSGNPPLLGIFLEIWKKQVYTPKGYEIKPNDLVIDIGANIGVFSLFAASKTKNKVYCFEPFPDNFDILKQNVIDSGMQNICCYKFAVGCSSGKRKLYTGNCNAGHSFFDMSTEGHINYIEVECKTLKQIFEENNIQICDFLKLDCEGCEFEIIFKTPTDYLNRIKKISMEFHDNVSNYTHLDLKQFLENAGFIVEIEKFDGSPFGYLRASNTSFKETKHENLLHK